MPAPEHRRELGHLHTSVRFVLRQWHEMVKSSFTDEEVEAQKGELFLTKATHSFEVAEAGPELSSAQPGAVRLGKTRTVGPGVPLREAPGHTGRPECHV